MEHNAAGVAGQDDTAMGCDRAGALRISPLGPGAAAASRRSAILGGTSAGGGLDSVGASLRDLPGMIAGVYEQASAPLRAKLLERLLGPVTSCAMDSIGDGAFSRFTPRRAEGPIRIGLADAQKIRSDHVLELARHLEYQRPALLRRLGWLMADWPFGWASIGGSALLIALLSVGLETGP